MNTRQCFHSMLTVLLFCAAGVAGATDIYKYQLADGSIYYTGTDEGTYHLIMVIQVPPKTRDEIARGRVEQRKLQQQTARADLLTAVREARLAQTKARMQIAAEELAYADLAMMTGQTPLPGERSAIRGGRSKLNSAYWERQRALRAQRDGWRDQVEQAGTAE